MKNVYLVGHMGAGKTTIGQELAKNLNINFVDTDRNLERMYNMPVTEIFKTRGEQEFRIYETASLLQTTLVDSTIVSTGGGILMRPCNGKYMKEAGLVIYLRMSEATQLDRLTRDKELKTRPIVASCKTKEELQQRIKYLHQERNLAYEYFADFAIDVDKKSVNSIVFTIANFLEANRLIIERNEHRGRFNTNEPHYSPYSRRRVQAKKIRIVEDI
ncbi:shikimate kinase [Psittacicella hinzii]|uniref:Shikimate kinase n=1 Tax=Psittacicella hinzii TaxID=2028575 RepID=A0A3A1YHA1_9GAMM|nr:shikimate kinase [Psittacicella hinzii]RIY37065.1 hypothetical protein CKF58_05420 [Psittacicella hinzii]